MRNDSSALKNLQLLNLVLSEHHLFSFLGKLNQSLRVEKDDNGSYQVRLIDRSYIKALATQVRDILATDPEGNLTVKDFSAAFQERYVRKCFPDEFGVKMENQLLKKLRNYYNVWGKSLS